MGIVKATKPSNIMSIDSSTKSVAFGCFANGDLYMHGKLSIDGPSIYARCGDIGRKMYAFVKNSSIEYIVIESSVFMNSPKSALALATIQGAILGSAIHAGVNEVQSVTPIQWQNFIGNPRLDIAEKRDVRKANPGRKDSWYRAQERKLRKQRTIDLVNAKYGTSINDDDIADAVGVGWFAVSNWARLSGKP